MEGPVRTGYSPAVSVIIPVHNSAQFLPGALKSVYDQTFLDYEVIVIDDGSTDNILEVIDCFKDPKLRFIQQANKGLAGARNTGLNAARGRYIAFLDADDLYLPGKLEQQVSWFEENPDYGFVSGGWNVIDEDRKILSSQKPWVNHPTLKLLDWLFSCPVVPIAILVKKSWISKINGFDARFRRVEDWDLWLRLAYAGCKMGWLEEIVCAYRISPGQMTRNAAEQKRVSIQMLDKFFSQSNLPEEILGLRPTVFANCYASCAGREYSVNQCEDAKFSISKAIELDPELINIKIDVLLNKLLSWTGDPFAGDPIDYTRRIFANLPSQADKLRSKKRWALGEIGLRAFNKAYEKKNWGKVRRAGMVVAFNAPQRMVNRGIWSILFQSVFHNRNS